MVYRAEHAEYGRCAVKTLKNRLSQDPTAVKRFLREAGYGTRVQHDHVVKTFDFGDQDGLYYLALEWAEGEPLSRLVEREESVDPSLVAHIVDQLADALAAAHAAGIIHRDLKPENIVFDSQTRTTKLLDFGIARDAQSDPADRLTRAGFFVGSVQYVPPEALSGELVDKKADIYSLATITYYLLTGRHPFPGASPKELFRQLLTGSPVPLNQASAFHRFSGDLERAVMTGLSRNPADRQSSVRQFADEIAEAVKALEERKSSGGVFVRALRGLLRLSKTRSS